ncbi:MAG TPA: hypothetical protein VHE81_09885 [Lacipirellulaceae bacterium]|nr:hypothetical protein [Lacipirellulaceae bacterium]
MIFPSRPIAPTRVAMLLIAWFLTGLTSGAQSPSSSKAPRPHVIPFSHATPAVVISPSEMRRIYAEIKTPFKYGIVIRPQKGESIDCPNVFRFGDKWYMVFVGTKNRSGYETFLAQSDDLLEWKQLGRILPFVGSGWDARQAAGGVALADFTWGGSGELQCYCGKYWLSYLGGAKTGYEPDPLAIGLAWSNSPDRAIAWHRLEENPVLAPDQPDARPFERATLYKSHIIWDKSLSLGYPFIMFYNAKQSGPWVERIGMAVSRDMLHWSRYGMAPVIDNGRGISGDPQVVRIRRTWVMFYFGAGWKHGAFDTFACSYDLVHWTKWSGPDLVSPSKSWDKTFAHKPWVLKHDGVVYHFYCAVGTEGRAIALATSKDLRASARRAR